MLGHGPGPESPILNPLPILVEVESPILRTQFELNAQRADLYSHFNKGHVSAQNGGPYTSMLSFFRFFCICNMAYA